ncbi:GNAT family N-acetyltransferase [Acidimangrovimonas sediminis]|uniref:GNAT family N-acetyltransferase n=1 Tax=Acidimangrovimonas sediminis TaxID=2056283 RepID=UPI000C802558|nr:GNAT family N-acetyltransferase [Acidimangrovimonas sediminis]
MSQPIIRSVKLEDFDALLKLYLELTNGAPVLGGRAGRTKLAEILEHSGTYVFGAELNGVLVSVASLHICPNLTFGGRSHARIENVVTAREHRGRGLARLVMEVAIDKAREQNVLSIILLTGKQLDVRGFYEKLGFNAEDKWGMIIRPQART